MGLIPGEGLKEIEQEVGFTEGAGLILRNVKPQDRKRTVGMLKGVGLTPEKGFKETGQWKTWISIYRATEDRVITGEEFRGVGLEEEAWSVPSGRSRGLSLPLVHLLEDLHAFGVAQLVAVRSLLPPGEDKENEGGGTGPPAPSPHREPRCPGSQASCSHPLAPPPFPESPGISPQPRIHTNLCRIFFHRSMFL